MIYKTIVTDYIPKAKKMAEAVEKAANTYAQKGWEPVTFSVTNSGKAILLFRVPEQSASESALQEGTGEKTSIEK